MAYTNPDATRSTSATYPDSAGRGPQDAQKVYDQGQRLIHEFIPVFSKIDNIRLLTRLREPQMIEINGQQTQVPRPSHAFALVSQARVFSDAAKMSFIVRPRDNSDQEDKATSQLERWCMGVERTVKPYNGRVYRDVKWHYFESGAGILLTTFNVDRAIEGCFPFDIQAVDPRACAFRRAGGKVIYAIIEEVKSAEVCYYELKQRYDSAKSPGFEIPKDLVDAYGSWPNASIKYTRCYDDEYEWLYVNSNFVWQMPHYMGRVPIDIGFCSDIPAEASRPEELGMGIVSPVLDMLLVEQKLMAKTIGPMDLFYYPLVAVQDGSSWRVIQAYPGLKLDSVMQQVTPFNAQPNFQVTEHLQSNVGQDMSRGSLPDAAFGPPMFRQSGFAWTQVMGGLEQKMYDYTKGLEDLFASHFGMLLENVEDMATDEMASELKLRGDDKKNFFRSFGVQTNLRENPSVGHKRIRAIVELKSSDVDGHHIVEVIMKPKLTSDESAVYQRGLIARQIGYSKDYVRRYVVRDEDLEQVEYADKKEELLQNDPEMKQFFQDKFKREMFLIDKDLSDEYQAWAQAMAEEAQGQGPGTAPTEQPGGPPGPGGQPPDVTPGNAQGQSQPAGNAPGTGTQGMQPPASFGMPPMK